MTERRSFSAAALAVAVLVTAQAFPAANAQPGKRFAIDFTPILDTTQGFRSFGSFPAINNRGAVAFMGAQNNGVIGVFRVEAGSLTTIASSDNGFSLFGDDVAVNPGGVVAFAANTASGSRAIFTGDGDVRTRIADTAVNGFVARNLGSPSINAAGTVAFSATLAQRGSPAGIFSGRGGPLQTIAGTSAGGFQAFQNAAINDAGTVVFAASLADGSRGVFTAFHQVTDIVDSIHRQEIDSLGDPVINNGGTVADVAFILPFFAPEIFTADTRAFTPRNDPSNPRFADSDHPSLNNRNAVAFAAIQLFSPSDPMGIFLEVSGGQALIPVVRPGDTLFGSTVVQVNLGRFALNDRFQMAFSYTLVDGRSGIAVASFNGESEE